jgi:hypothetical protein
MSQKPVDIEKFIEEAFEHNYERLRSESGHALSPELKRTAREQVVYYFRKLRHIATSITDTEVHLNLSRQKSPKGRKFGIEGVVDIVRGQGRTVMYDIKTHEANYVRDNPDFYQRQLDVYAHIWQDLRKQKLDETAIITTPLPGPLKEALRIRDRARIKQELQAWDPVVPIPTDKKRLDETIRDFGEVVDAIEERRFAPASVTRLRRREPGDEKTFGTRVCRNCDARYSCRSFREYAKATRLVKYYEDLGVEEDRVTWLEAAIPVEEANPRKGSRRPR